MAIRCDTEAAGVGYVRRELFSERVEPVGSPTNTAQIGLQIQRGHL